MLIEIAEAFADDGFHTIPPEVTKADYPAHWLARLLDSTEGLCRTSIYAGRTYRNYRACDAAAMAVQALVGKDFGFSADAWQWRRDRAIARIKRRWAAPPAHGPESPRGGGAPVEPPR